MLKASKEKTFQNQTTKKDSGAIKNVKSQLLIFKNQKKMKSEFLNLELKKTIKNSRELKKM